MVSVLFLYNLLNYVGYFLIMIILMVIAIITAKNKTAWIWYGIGAVLQLLSLFGNQRVASMYGTNITWYWIIYFILLIFTAAIVAYRYNKRDVAPTKTACDALSNVSAETMETHSVAQINNENNIASKAFPQKNSKINALKKGDKLFSFYIISTIVLTSISIIAWIFLIVMICNETIFTSYEAIATVLCLIQISVLVILFALSIHSIKTHKTTLLMCIAGIYFVASLISTVFIHSIMYNDLPGFILLLSIFLVLIMLPMLIKKIIIKHHSSVTYREHCYKRVEKIYRYLEKGIISQEEYETAKNDILKNVINPSK